jgi:Holliday junction resolvasome RuvABC endonuclease subunit
MIVLGWDPGTTNLAWAALSLEPRRTRVVGHGVIGVSVADVEDDTGELLNELAARIANVTEHTLPDVVGYEAQAGAHAGHDQRGGLRSSTARLVNDVTGMLRFAARVLFEEPVPVYAIQPQSAKVALLGRGTRSADKEQVRAGVRRMFGVSASSHEADAVAIAVATVRRYRRDQAMILRKKAC